MIRSFRALLLATLPLLVLSSSCADQGAPTGPAASPAPVLTQAQAEAKLDRIAKFDRRPSVTIAWAKKWIGPEGGRLDFAGFAVEVPAGAVDRMTQFSIRLPVDPSGSERVVAELGPHGATFRTPVFIEFPLTGTSIADSATPTVVWWDGTRWVDMGGAPTADGVRLRTTTDHFSEFGTTASAFSGGTLVSGG